MPRIKNHLDGGLDGRFVLVGIQPDGFQRAPLELPVDGGLHEGVGTAARRDVDCIVGQRRELAAALPFVDFLHRLHECVILSVAHRTFHIFLAVDFHLDDSRRAQALRDRKLVVD